ncbi:YdeI/OmpD-associated family protein [Aquisphaera insulae]|uniref:YdeI/OmpD-associated family protein n=1 Tax=Aquisphaera insulae TaxID=2712864 RepID=UPI0013EC838F|nr:YdeI/OmpD-associated family protein [Aquisphaera insulae]
MSNRDARVDAYIAKSAEFARPILTHLREVVHAACPDVEETIKWGFPHFQRKGILCSMAAFKEHCAFGFWKEKLILGTAEGAESTAEAGEKTAMGQFGRLKKISDLPSKKVLTSYVKQAVKLNEDGVKSPTRSRPKGPAKEVVVPDDLAALLDANPPASATFDGFPPSHRREYVDWINEAKTQPTRSRRLEQAISWLAEGKPRNWKYMNC